MNNLKYLFHIEGKRKGAIKFTSTTVIREGVDMVDARSKIYDEFEKFNVQSFKKIK